MILLFCERNIETYDEKKGPGTEKRWTFVAEHPTADAAWERAKLEAENAAVSPMHNTTGRYGVLDVGDTPKLDEIKSATVPERTVTLRKVSK